MLEQKNYQELTRHRDIHRLFWTKRREMDRSIVSRLIAIKKFS